MGKNKLKKFAEMETLPNVYQCTFHEAGEHHPVTELAGKWHSDVFHNDNPIVLELGCGRGDYSVGLARLYPEKNFIGIDIKGARIWAGAKEAYTTGLQNVAFLRTNIEAITSFFAAGEVSEIWITFPDPQMKKATKRLTSTYFMARYQQIMVEGGTMHLKTDSPFLYTYTREMLKDNAYAVKADTEDLYGKCNVESVECSVKCNVESVECNVLNDARALKTHYEKQWLDRGLTIKYLCWLLEHKEQFAEPTIEIEKDTYRSYGRNYHSSNDSCE